MFDFNIVTQWFDGLLRQTLGLSNFWSILIECVVVGLLISHGLCSHCYGVDIHGA